MLIIIFTINWIKSSYIFFSFKWLTVGVEPKKQQKCRTQANWHPGHSLRLVWQRHWAERMVVAGVTRIASYPEARGDARLSWPKETLDKNQEQGLHSYFYIGSKPPPSSLYHHVSLPKVGQFFLLLPLKFRWLHGPCTVHPNKSIFGTRSQRGWPWPGREIIKTCFRAQAPAPCNSITDRSWARHGFGHQTGCGETTALTPDPPAPLCLQHRWAWMKAITPSL